MPVILSLPACARPPCGGVMNDGAIAALTAAGWYCVELNGPPSTHRGAIARANVAARGSDCDVLVIGTGVATIAPAVISELGKEREADVVTDVVVALADPLDVLWHNWSKMVADGAVASLDHALAEMPAQPEDLPDLMPMACLAPLLADARVCVHVVATAQVNGSVLGMLLCDVLGIKLRGDEDFGNADSPDQKAVKAIATADAKRLISMLLLRDNGIADEKLRSDLLARCSQTEWVALADLIAETAPTARRDLTLNLSDDLAAAASAFTDRLAGCWRGDAAALTDLSRGVAQLRFTDVDAALSVGAIADATSDVIAGLCSEGPLAAGKRAPLAVVSQGPSDNFKRDPQPGPDGLDASLEQSHESAPKLDPAVGRSGVAAGKFAPTAPGVGTSDRRPDKPRLLVLGHSHIGALDLAWKAMGAEEREFEYCSAHLNGPRFQPNFEQGKGGRHIAPGFRIALGQLIDAEAPNLVVALPMGNEYNAVAMTPVGPPFDVRLPGDERAPTDGVWQIPYPMMRAQIATLAERNALLILSAIAEVADCPVIALPPPPPVFDEEHIRAHPGRFAEAIGESGLNPPALRSRIWALYVEVLAQSLKGTPVQPLALPDRVIENQGDQPFLAPDMCAQDPTHANARYGAALLKLIAEEIHSSKANAA